MHSDLRCASRSAHARGTPVHKQRQSEGGRRQRPSEAIRGHQRQSEAIRERSAAVNGQPQPIGNRSKAVIRVHQWSSGVIGNRSKVISGPSSSAQSSSAYLPSEGLELFMKGVIRGHQGPSRSSAYLPSEGLKLFMKGPHHRR